MAARNDSRGPWTVVRGSGNHPQIQRSLRVPRKPARNPSTSKPGSRGFDRPNPLAEITRRLEVIGAIAITAEVALRTQNCEQDADIAKCLRHGVVDALSTQIERIGRLCISTRKSYIAGELS
jgi:hypothetical protein